TTFPWTADLLPLEQGKTYAWTLTVRDADGRLPFSDDGRTEIVTFTMGEAESASTDGRMWRFPVQGPFVQVRIEPAEVTEINGTAVGTMGDGGPDVQVTFDDVTLDDGDKIQDGSVRFAEALRLWAPVESIRTDGGATLGAFEAVMEPPLGVDGLLLTLPPEAFVDAGGLQFASGQAGVNALGVQGTFRAAPSADLRIGPEQPRISAGRIDFMLGTDRVAYADAAGLHAVAAPQVIFSALRVGLPNVDIAYLELTPEVAYFDSLTDGTVAVRAREDALVEVVIPGLPAAPRFAAMLGDVVLEGDRIVRGHVEGRDPLGISEPIGMPLILHDVVFTPEEGLVLGGPLALLGQETGIALALPVGPYGEIDARIEASGPPFTLALVPGSLRAVLQGTRVSGTVRTDLYVPAANPADLYVTADFVVQDAGTVYARSGLELRYRGAGPVEVLELENRPTGMGPRLELGMFGLSIQAVRSFQLRYTTEPYFRANLDLGLHLPLSDAEAVVPLGHGSIRSTGLFIPRQDQHEGRPGFPQVEAQLGPLDLRLLAFRHEPVSFDWFEWSPGEPTGIDPHVDFEASLFGFSAGGPRLASAGLTLQDATFVDGMLAGPLLPYTFDRPAGVVLGEDVTFAVTTVSGSVGGAQPLDVRLEGQVDARTATATCAYPDVAAAVVGVAGVEGTTAATQPCVTLPFAGLTLGFADETLSLRVADGVQQAVVSGPVAEQVMMNETMVSAEGTLAADLLTHRLLESDVVLGRFPWPYPADLPSFAFEVAGARLQLDGLALETSGRLIAGASSVDVRFEEARIGVDGGFADGRAVFQGSFGLASSAGPLRWTAVATGTPPAAGHNLRVDLPPGMVLTAEGLQPGATGGASLAIGEVRHDALTVAFDGFTFGFEAAPVLSGRADLNEDDTRLAFVDPQGLHFDGIQAPISLPARLGLPTEAVAYLEIRDEGGTLLVQETPYLGGTVPGRQIASRGGGVRLVLTSLGGEAPLVVDGVTFEGLVLNSADEIVAGTLNVEGIGLDLAAAGLPLILQRLRFGPTAFGARLLTADVTFSPGMALTRLSTVISDLPLTPGGLGGFALGSYAQNGAPDEALAQQVYHDGRFDVRLEGIRFEGGARPVEMAGSARSVLFQTSEGARASVPYSARFDIGGWTWAVGLDDIPSGTLPVRDGTLRPEALDAAASPIVATLAEEAFGLTFQGVLTLPTAFGRDVSLSVRDLRIATDGVDAGAASDGAQQLDLYGGILTIETQAPTLAFADDRLQVVFNEGSFDFFGNEGLPLTGRALTFGLDGDVTMQEGNLLADSLTALKDDALVIRRLGFAQEQDEWLLDVGAVAVLPSPMKQTRAPYTLRARADGAVTAIGVPFSFDEGYRIGNNEEAEFRLGGSERNPDAVFELLALHLDTDLRSPGTTVL
ncbi:MAG TPA: hypothetical protein VMN39_11750, partial [Longimicrobiaceae bacterium]|nr:hypothetical protein [Longimicrobiaceae bacterium]